MPAAEHTRRASGIAWSVPILAVLGVAGLILGWRTGVLGWYAGAVLLGLALAALVAGREWSRWCYLGALALVAALIAVPALVRPGDAASYRITADEPRVSAGAGVFLTLEWQDQESRLSAWSEADGTQLWTMAEDAPRPTDSTYPLPMLIGDVALTGALSPVDAIDDWPTLSALEASTGEELWRSDVAGAVRGSHNSVLVVATPERTMDALGPATLRGLDLASGEVRWQIEGVAPTAGLPMVATDSDAADWGAHLPVLEDLPLLAVRPVGPDGMAAGARLVEADTGEEVAELPARADDGVFILGEQAGLVRRTGATRDFQVTGYDAAGEQTWRTEVDSDVPDVNGLDLVGNGAVMTAGHWVLLDDATAALDLRTGEITDYLVQPVPAAYDDILMGPDYVLTTAVTETGYFAVIDLAGGTVRGIPEGISSAARPDAFLGGPDGAALYSGVVQRPFGRSECRVWVVNLRDMTEEEHVLGECDDAAPVQFWGAAPMAQVASAWVAIRPS